MTLGDRIAARMTELGISQSELARRIGVSQQAIGKLVNGQVQTSRHLHVIARELGTTPQYLTGETNDPSEGALPVPTPEQLADQLDIVLVPELVIADSIGNESVLSASQRVGSVPFHKSWLHGQVARNISDLFIVRGAGDSMEPTLGDGDIVLVDSAQTKVNRQDAIWALMYAGLGMIRRVRKLPGGGYRITSDNKAVSPLEVPESEVQVIGRVIWIGRSV